MKNKITSFLNYFFLTITILSLCLGPMVYARKFNAGTDTPVWMTIVQLVLYIAFVGFTVRFVVREFVKRKV